MSPALEHDKKVCLFGIAFLASGRNGGPAHPDSFPDEEERQQRAIDLVAHDALGVICCEHTLIEPYGEQLYDNRVIGELLGDFPNRFEHTLPGPGRYTLGLHAMIVRGPDEHARSCRRAGGLGAGAKAPAPEIPRTIPNNVGAMPPEVPLQVTLYRMTCLPEDDLSLQVALLRPDDIEEQRVDRMRRAFLDKAEKLEEARRPGSVTLLVLECRDFILSNPPIVAQAAYSAGQGFDLIPDAIVCVDVPLETAAGWPIKSNGPGDGRGRSELAVSLRIRFEARERRPRRAEASS